MPENKKATLVLENGAQFQGFSFGTPVSVSGEVVFNTAMIGYPQILTSPSYAGQIVVLTYPLIGNYGVPQEELEEGISKYFESEKIHAKAVIVSDYSFDYSHWNAAKSLSEWLVEQGVPAIYAVDTREITKIIRENGTMSAKVVVEGCEQITEKPIKPTGCTESTTYGGGKYRIALLDCGCDNSIVKALLGHDTTIIKVPCDYDLTTLKYDGLLLGTGPGDPKSYARTVENIRKALERNEPILGIGLGHQLLALAAGADTYKLKAGHRSHNHPVIMAGKNRAAITTQEHGYAVDAKSLPDQWEESFVSLNDGTNEGIKHKSKPFGSIQFHSEASSGAITSEFIFGQFIESINKSKQ